MKSFLLVFLFMYSFHGVYVSATTEEEDPVEMIFDTSKRYESASLIQMAGEIGCFYNCTHRPLNVPQLPLCLAATYLGTSMAKLSKCGVVRDGNLCQATKESADASAADCIWIALTPYWGLGGGFCVPRILYPYKDVVFGVLSVFKPILDRRTERVAHIVTCLGKTKSTCNGNSCKLCDSIPAKNYPATPELTEVCLPESWHEEFCHLLKAPADGKDLRYCPFAKKAATSVCYNNLCPGSANAEPDAKEDDGKEDGGKEDSKPKSSKEESSGNKSSKETCPEKVCDKEACQNVACAKGYSAKNSGYKSSGVFVLSMILIYTLTLHV